MVELSANSPCGALLPVTIGNVTLSETDAGSLTSIAPFAGKDEALSKTLRSAHGMSAPGPNRTTGRNGARAVWFGSRMILLQGPEPDVALAKHAALTDQSAGWAVTRLEGDHAADVLARLTPIDLRRSQFKRGHTARTELRHMMASITRIGAQSFQIMVFRSFAETFVHDLKTAMQSVAARQP